MIGALISVILTLVIVGVLWWAVNEILGVIPVAEPIRRVIRVLMILVLALIVIWVLLWLLGQVGVHVATPLLR